MPYTSDKQRRWAHTPTGKKALGGASAVKEWDTASRGMELPESSKTKKSMDRNDPLWGPNPGDMEDGIRSTKKPLLKPRKSLSKENLIMALDKAGHRESALLLKNWNEEDAMAKKLRKQVEESTSSEDHEPDYDAQRKDDKIDFPGRK